MLSAKLTLAHRVAELRDVTALLAPWERERAKVQPELRVLMRGLEKKEKGNGNGGQTERWGMASATIAKVAGFSQSTDHAMKLLQARLLTLAKTAEQDRRELSVMVDRLLEDTRKALMLPFTSFLEAIPKLVRDLARDSGKEVGLVVQGGEIEVTGGSWRK
jgi:two-component system, chemotaxis family, sensor kinase CheA